MVEDAQKTSARRGLKARVVNAALDVVSLVPAIASAMSLYRVLGILGRNPFGWSDIAELLIAAFFAFSCWGFFRLIGRLLMLEPLSLAHPGHITWFLAGGVWTMVAAADVVVQGSSHIDDAANRLTMLGTLLATPLLVTLVLQGLLRGERQKADWRAWAGLAVAALFPVLVLVWFIRSP